MGMNRYELRTCSAARPYSHAVINYGLLNNRPPCNIHSRLSPKEHPDIRASSKLFRESAHGNKSMPQINILKWTKHNHLSVEIPKAALLRPKVSKISSRALQSFSVEQANP